MFLLSSIIIYISHPSGKHHRVCSISSRNGGSKGRHLGSLCFPSTSHLKSYLLSSELTSTLRMSTLQSGYLFLHPSNV